MTASLIRAFLLFAVAIVIGYDTIRTMIDQDSAGIRDYLILIVCGFLFFRGLYAFIRRD